MTSINHHENNQNFWQLASIQTASLGVLGIIISKALADKYGPGAAIASILIGNLILWFIAFAIVSMAIKERRNAIENAEEYIGKFGTKLVALISMTIFPIWYAIQIQSTTEPIDNSLFSDLTHHEFTTSLYGIALGITIAFVASFRLIHIIKRLTTIFLPILISYYLYAILSAKSSVSLANGLEFSWPCMLAYISFLFAGMVNLPTFFRHARSKYDSYLALTLMIIIIIFFQISSIWMSPGILIGSLFETSINHPFFLSILLKIANIAFSVMLLICTNLVNIYFSYPSWEFVIPKIKKYPKFLIIGLTGTAIYALIRIFPNIYNLINECAAVADDFIAILGITLLLIFAVRIVVRHRPKPFEKIISTVSWIIGCIAIVIAITQNSETPPLLVGIWTTILFFGVIIFIEEPFWSFKKLKEWLNRNSR